MEKSIVVTFPSKRTCTRVVGEGLQGAGSAVGAWVVVARVVGDRDLTEGGRVADGTGALKGWSTRFRHEYVTGSAILALETAGITRVLVLAVFSDIFWRTTEKKITFINQH